MQSQLLIQPHDGMEFFGSPVCFAEDKRYERTVVDRDPLTGFEFERKESPIIWRCANSNLVVDPGRKNALKQTFGTGSPATVTFTHGSVGDDPASPSSYVETHLKSELINVDGTYTTRRPIVSLSGGALADADYTLDPVGANRYKVIFKFIYPTDHPTNGETYAEFGVHSTGTLPGSPTSASGTMLARFVPTTAFDKDGAFQVTMQWTMRS